MAEKGLNATAAALLGLLHEGPMTGGQLMATAENRLGPFWTTTRSQVYRELPVLAERGFVRLGRPGPRSSQPYAITASGKRVFAKWLGEDAGRDQLRNPLMLRAAFGSLHKPQQLQELYAERREEHNARLAELREELKEVKKRDDAFQAATLEFAIQYQRSILKWLDTAPGLSGS
ncbi:PadR family transcriptional regulator [Cryptosporangium sp. NPDC048952]|uniref:PadR family transcriptional regulator n=1 Tax=Cryptosporangium sp. NPDC048952 TaxID=3363961 RepID=UPI00371F6B34